MRILKIGVNFLLSFSLMLLLIVNELSFVTSATLLNSDYYSETLTQVGYYDQLGTALENGLINTGLASGLPKEVFQNSIDRRWLEGQVNQYIASLIDYLTFKSDSISYQFESKPLEAKLNQAIVGYAQQMGMPINKEDLTSLKALVIQNVQQRILVVGPQNPVFSSLRQFTGRLVLNRGYFVLASLFILLGLFFVNRKKPYQFIHWLAYSLLASGLFLVLPAFSLLSSSVLNRFALNELYLRQAIGAILERFVSVTLYTGLATVLIGIFLVFVGARVTPSDNKHSSRLP